MPSLGVSKPLNRKLILVYPNVARDLVLEKSVLEKLFIAEAEHRHREHAIVELVLEGEADVRVQIGLPLIDYVVI